MTTVRFHTGGSRHERRLLASIEGPSIWYAHNVVLVLLVGHDGFESAICNREWRGGFVRLVEIKSTKLIFSQNRVAEQMSIK